MKEAKRGERGQPWLTPSFMRRVRQAPSSHLWCTVVAFWLNSVVRGRISGKDVSMTLKNSSRDTLLNWLVRSKKTAAREGRVLVRWGVWMNFSMESCIAFTTSCCH
jgi:hypothetical protein